MDEAGPERVEAELLEGARMAQMELNRKEMETIERKWMYKKFKQYLVGYKYKAQILTVKFVSPEKDFREAPF